MSKELKTFINLILFSHPRRNLKWILKRIARSLTPSTTIREEARKALKAII